MGRLLAAITSKCRAVIAEWAARREGSRHLPRDIFTATRHIVGPTGYAWSGTWQRLDEDGADYLRSFDPRIPASVFLSPSDLTRSVHPGTPGRALHRGLAGTGAAGSDFVITA